jgi:putative FmdB family regulatory protein
VPALGTSTREDVVPTYQYACTECGHDLEAVQSFTDDALTECPVCHGRLRKVFGAVGIVFKGSGFYRNDSRDKKAAGDTPAKVDAKTDAPKGDAKKADADKRASTKGTDSGSAKPAAASSSSASASSGSSTKGSAA